MATVEWGVSQDAEQLHRASIVMDMTMPMVPGGRISELLSSLDTISRSGVNYITLTLGADDTSTRSAMRNIRLIKLVLLLKWRSVRVVCSPEQIRKAVADGKLAIGLHFQGTGPIEDDLSLIESFNRRGVRQMLMAYNGKNRVGYGCHEEFDHGLTDFGRALIAEMNRVGMIVDVAHTGYKTAMDTIEASLSPVVISHGNVMALGNHPRCVGDDMISAIAANRGVIGITGLGLFLGNAGATVENYVAHIDHIVQLTGPEHVGIGLDYIYDIDSLLKFAAKHPAQYPPEGGYLDDLQQIEHAQLPAVTDALLKRGYSDDSVRNILGGNWLRLIEEVWR